MAKYMNTIYVYTTLLDGTNYMFYKQATNIQD